MCPPQHVAHIRPSGDRPPELTPTAADNQWMVNRNRWPIEQLSIAIHQQGYTGARLS
jgi:hypothetical protein